MIEIRRGDTLRPGWTQQAYEDIYRAEGIRQLDSFYVWLLRLLQADPGRTLLDVACGEGSLPRLAARAGLRAYGVDLSHMALRIAAGEAHLAYAVADGERLPFPDSSFDYVTSIGSLEHYLDLSLGARELARVLKPGARSLVLLPNTFSLTGNVYRALKTGWPVDDGQPLQRYASRGQWQRLLETSGLRVWRVVKYEREWPVTVADAAWYLRHPKPLIRLMMTPFIPLNLASCFIYLCQKDVDDPVG